MVGLHDLYVRVQRFGSLTNGPDNKLLVFVFYLYGKARGLVLTVLAVVRLFPLPSFCPLHPSHLQFSPSPLLSILYGKMFYELKERKYSLPALFLISIINSMKLGMLLF